MENQTQQNEILTKANQDAQIESATLKSDTVKGVVLSTKDVEEYRVFKRKKLMDEIMLAMSKSEASLLGEEDLQRVCERALRLKQSGIQLPSSKLISAKKCLLGIEQAKKNGRFLTVKEYLNAKRAKTEKKTAERKVRLDCVISGDVSTKVKAYEARYALARGAKELTLVLTPSFIEGGKYGEIRKEVRKLVAISKKTTLKVFVENEYPMSTLSRLARLVSEVGAQYFCVPYFEGCEKLRFDLVNGCKLQVSGVNTLAQYKKMTLIGAGRIVCDKAYEIYEEWMQETEKIEFAKPALLLKDTEDENEPLKPLNPPEWQNMPTVEPQRKSPLPLSRVVQSGVNEKEEEKGIKML